MKKTLLSMGLCTVVALSALAQPQMVASYKIGDSMGAEGVTLKSVNLYDSQNKIIRTYNLATDYAGDTYTETIIYYVYNAQGQLVEDYSSQFQPAYNKWEEGDRNVYQYDEQGRLIQIDDANRGYKYTYNENGYLVNEQYYSNSTPTTIQDINYFDFDANGNPARAESNGYQSDYRFDAVYTYDEQGRCIDIMRHCIAGTVHSRTTNAFDEAGVLVDNYEYMSAYGKGGREGGEVGGVKDTLRHNFHTERTLIANGWYNKITWTWDTTLKMFTKGSTSYNELYVNLDGAYAPLNVVAENISTKEMPNTAKITAEVPATLPEGNLSYIIWRNGEIAGTVAAVDGKIEFIDSEVENGSYEYIVQTYDATNDIYYNSSDIANVDITTPLSMAENVRIVGGYHGTYNDPQVGEYETFFIKLQWDVAPCDDAILGYKVWVYPWAYPMLEITDDTKSCELSMADDEVANIRIDVVYEHGVKEGEYVPLFWDNSADFDGEPIVEYFLTYELNYGDHMGGAGASSINYYVYNQNNKLSRRMDYGYQTDGSTVPTYHYFYEYNNNGQLISEFYRQMNAMGEWGKNKMTYVYTYDVQGQLISKEDTTSNRLYEYAYDEQGRLVTITDKGKTFGQDEYDKLYSTTTYSQFDENGNPGYAEFVHAMYASSSYNTTYTYDEKGRISIQESRNPEGMAYEKFTYEYDKYGIVTYMTKYMPYYDEKTYQPTERFVLSFRTVREAQGGMVYKRYDENYDLKTETWSTNGRYTMETYSPLNGSLTPQNLVATNVSSAESPNTIEIECNFPKARLANAHYIIWRGWIPVDTIEHQDNKGIIRFTDVNVENGTYEYIVQTYDAATQQAFNATSPVVVTMAAELLPISDLRCTGHSEGVYRDPELGDMPAYWVHLAWNAPESVLPILGYNIYQDGFKIPVSTTTNCNDSVWVYREEEANIANQQQVTNVEVRVLYQLGESEGVFAEFDATAIESITYTGSAYVAGKTLFVEPNAEVTIFNVSGATVAAYNNRENIDLSALPAGVYVAIVKVGKEAQVLKVAL